MSYCELCNALPDNTDNPHKFYHDHEYGFPICDDNQLFERLILEINQAGLSWDTILKKRPHLIKAYANFDLARVANFNNDDIQRLLNDPNIIRNRLKIDATIYNAQQIIKLQKEFGSFKQWLDVHHSDYINDWLKLFKHHFKFVGKTILTEFLISCAYLEGAHNTNCPIFKTIQAIK